MKYGIWYTKAPDYKRVEFSDNDWTGCIDDRKSTSGQIFSLGSGVVTWSSKK